MGWCNGVARTALMSTAEFDSGGETPQPPKVWRRGVLIGLGFVATLLALELGLRAAEALRDRPAPVADTSENVVRVLCLGESITAFGGNQSYPSQLEGLLNRDGRGKRFTVVNGGVAGITTETMLQQLDEQLERHRPQIVVTMLGVNDEAFGLGNAGRLPIQAALHRATLTHLALAIQESRLKLQGTAVDDAPHNPIVDRAWQLFGTGQADEALAELRQAVAGPEPRAEVVQTLVSFLMVSSRLEEAKTVAGQWIAAHPNDTAMRETLFRIPFRQATLAIKDGRLDEAERAFTELERAAAETHPEFLVLAQGKLASIADIRGDHAAAAAYRAAAASGRTGIADEATKQSYRRLVSIVQQRGIRVVAMQYPLRSVDTLRELLGDPPGVTYVDNDATFQTALQIAPWEHWFNDTVAGDFGHTARAGSRLLAENVARVILAPPSAGNGT